MYVERGKKIEINLWILDFPLRNGLEVSPHEITKDE